MASNKAPSAAAGSSGGGLKGFFAKASHSFQAGGLWAKGWAQWGFHMSGKVGFVIASTSFVTLLPLIFEVSREGQVCTVVLVLCSQFVSLL
jgi:hypothetical protein